MYINVTETIQESFNNVFLRKILELATVMVVVSVIVFFCNLTEFGLNIQMNANVTGIT